MKSVIAIRGFLKCILFRLWYSLTKRQTIDRIAAQMLHRLKQTQSYFMMLLPEYLYFSLWFPSGIWPDGADGTDINAVCRSHDGSLLASADDFGKVHLFSFPCSHPRVSHVALHLHSLHISFSICLFAWKLFLKSAVFRPKSIRPHCSAKWKLSLWNHPQTQNSYCFL